MNLINKTILFIALILMKNTIQSADFFLNTQSAPRTIYEAFDASKTYEELKSLSSIPDDEIFVSIDDNSAYARLALLEKDGQLGYKVKYFTLEKPNSSLIFKTKAAADEFLMIFLSGNLITRRHYVPLPPHGSGQSWRRAGYRTSSSSNKSQSRR